MHCLQVLAVMLVLSLSSVANGIVHIFIIMQTLTFCSCVEWEIYVCMGLDIKLSYCVFGRNTLMYELVKWVWFVLSSFLGTDSVWCVLL